MKFLVKILINFNGKSKTNLVKFGKPSGALPQNPGAASPPARAPSESLPLDPPN